MQPFGKTTTRCRRTAEVDDTVRRSIADPYRRFYSTARFLSTVSTPPFRMCTQPLLPVRQNALPNRTLPWMHRSRAGRTTVWPHLGARSTQPYSADIGQDETSAWQRSLTGQARAFLSRIVQRIQAPKDRSVCVPPAPETPAPVSAPPPAPPINYCFEARANHSVCRRLR